MRFKSASAVLSAPFISMMVAQFAFWNSNPARASQPASASHLWKAVPDDVYWQEIGTRILSESPISSVAVLGTNVFVVQDGSIRQLIKDKLQDQPKAPRSISRLRTLAGAVWALSPEAIYRLEGGNWKQIDKRGLVDICEHLGSVYAASIDDLFRLEQDHFVSARPQGGYLSSDSTVVMEDFSQVLVDPVQIGPIHRIASYSGTLYLLGPGRISLLEGRTFVPDPIDWGSLPSRNTRDMISIGNRLYVATDRGLGVLRGMAMTSVRGCDGLPFEDLTCLAPGGDGDLWIGTSRGAIRVTGDQYHYFGAQRWLPSDNVRDIAATDHAVYIATDSGLGIIRYEPFTLLKKSKWFERDMDQWGFKRLGFVHKLYRANDEWLREISDNDGGNTAHWLTAMSFKYAATGDEAAREEAVRAFRAMSWLQEITGDSGLIARAIWSVKGDKGERSTTGSGGLPAKWYPSPDGLWLWKGDTSSDEVNAHFYAVSVFYELAAKGAEKEHARQHIAKLAGHILEHGWTLRDPDGKATRWGRWDPGYLQRPYGFEARGLNGMEAQTYMQTAYALTGDAKFQAGLEQLIKWRYPAQTVRQRITFPPEQVVPWDDELAFFCYYPLLKYAKDSDLRSIYLRSLERSWEIVRIQQIPFYNFIYGISTGNDCEAPEAMRHLREWSLELINYGYHNSQRADLSPVHGYVPYSGGTRAISPRELESKWGARDSLQYDGGEDGRGVTPPTGWLADYWMGRYYGFIEAPRTEEGSALELEAPAPIVHGAQAYAGPPAPAVKW